jgi:hypothetical protein
MTQINEILKRKAGDGPKQVRVVGVRAGRYIVTDADEFAPPFELEPAELAERYGGDPQLIGEIDEDQGWREFGTSYVRRLAEGGDLPEALTPEQELTAEAAAEQD